MDLGARLKTIAQFGHHGVVNSRLRKPRPTRRPPRRIRDEWFLLACDVVRHISLATADKDRREGGME